jgi:nitrogen regulatory protein PII
MKEIKAYIRRECLDAVVNRLAEVRELSGISLSAVTGFGRSRGVLRFVDFDSHVKLETVCKDELVEQVVGIIQENACTKHRGDGKIFVAAAEQAVRIETGQRNESSVL